MNTKKLEIFCDFDGTITVGDTVDLLLEKLALPEWEALEELWQKGEISSGECMTKQIALIQGGWPAVEKVLDTVAVDRGLASFVVWCRQQNIAFNIVSDGLDQVIKKLLTREKVSVDALWSNHLIEAENGSLSLVIPAREHRVVCETGRCKCQVLDMAGSDKLKVVIGDGRSDYCWARNADILFAKDSLLKHCLKQGIPCIPYESLVEVRVALQDMLLTDSESMGITEEQDTEHYIGTPTTWGGAQVITG